MLGKGAFGRVNLAMHKVTEHLVAVKSMNKQFLAQDNLENNEEFLNEEKKKLLQELLILQKVATRHRNIVRLYDSFETARHLVFVMELCAGGDILTYVRKRGCLSEDVARELFSQAASAVHYCHRKGIVHRDIKLDNMLLDVGKSGKKSGTVTLKLCDFGVSKLLTDPENDVMTEQCGTPAYIAPEILLGC
jgi:serine/threonine protein kinase